MDNGRYDFQIITFQDLENAPVIAETFSFLTVRPEGQVFPLLASRAMRTIFSSGLLPWVSRPMTS
jgi:hypothetical protein